MRSEELASHADALIWAWHEWKLFFERSIAFSQDAVHVIAGVLVQFAAALVLRKPISSWWPWLVVLAATFVNEAIDLRVETWPDSWMQYGEGFKDLLLTMLLPTLLMAAARWAPQLFRRRR